MSCVVGRLGLPVFQTWSMGLKTRKFGAAGSLYDILQMSVSIIVWKLETGILEDECAAIMQDFFRNRRKNNFAFKMNRNVI